MLHFLLVRRFVLYLLTYNVPYIYIPRARTFLHTRTDTESNSKMLSMILRKHAPGVECDFAQNGKIAVEKVGAEMTKYCLIFMDNFMPEMVSASCRLHASFITRHPRYFIYHDCALIAIILTIHYLS